MRGKPAQRRDASAHGYLLAEDAHAARAIDKPPPKRACRLEAGEHDHRVGIRQIVQEVIFDASGIAHPARRDDERAMPHVVQSFGFFERFGEAHFEAGGGVFLPHAMSSRVSRSTML